LSEIDRQVEELGRLLGQAPEARCPRLWAIGSKRSARCCPPDGMGAGHRLGLFALIGNVVALLVYLLVRSRNGEEPLAK